jgi:hypothetical protein
MLQRKLSSFGAQSTQSNSNNNNNSQKTGQIRVGRIVTKERQKIHPSYEGFTPIRVLTASTDFGHLGPYVLRDDKGRIMENIWQFSKVYKDVPRSIQTYSQWDRRTIWDHPAEVHVDPVTDQPNEKYWAWRKKGESNKDAVRYPVGMYHRNKCLYSLEESAPTRHLNYIEARKAIYLPVYERLVRQQKDFEALQKRLHGGENLLIIEVDGPHQESLDYYKQKYSVGDDFIIGETSLATKENLEIFLNDSRHPFGHGYCLAAALLDIQLDTSISSDSGPKKSKEEVSASLQKAKVRDPSVKKQKLEKEQE